MLYNVSNFSINNFWVHIMRVCVKPVMCMYKPVLPDLVWIVGHPDQEIVVRLAPDLFDRIKDRCP